MAEQAPSILYDAELGEADPVDRLVRRAGGGEAEAALLRAVAQRRVEERLVLVLRERPDLEESVAAIHDHLQRRAGGARRVGVLHLVLRRVALLARPPAEGVVARRED